MRRLILEYNMDAAGEMLTAALLELLNEAKKDMVISYEWGDGDESHGNGWGTAKLCGGNIYEQMKALREG